MQPSAPASTSQWRFYYTSNDEPGQFTIEALNRHDCGRRYLVASDCTGAEPLVYIGSSSDPHRKFAATKYSHSGNLYVLASEQDNDECSETKYIKVRNTDPPTMTLTSKL